MSEINENPVNESVEQSAEMVPTQSTKNRKETTPKAEEDFDWEAFEGSKTTNTAASKQEMMDLYDNTLSILQEKELLMEESFL